MKRFPAGALLLVALAAGAALRLPRLGLRPMHGDEAIQAVKTWELRETGNASYDPHAYHGPALAYTTLPALALSRASSFAATAEWHYRVIPALFGLGLVLLAWALRDGIGRRAAAAAAALAAVSPALVYYSRYYIQESLLAFFTGLVIAGGWRWVRGGSRGWLYAGAAAVGLALAAKETAFIALGAMAAAALTLRRPWPWRKLMGPGALALGVAALCFSSFLTRPAGLLDAVSAPLNYVRLGVGGSVHDHAVHYYLGLLLWSHLETGAVFTEAAILALGAAGAVFGWANGGLPRFLAAYTVVMIAAYSLIPYKTPWCMLSFLHGLSLLAGFGAVRLLEKLPGPAAGRAAAAAILLAAAGHLAWQAHRASFVFDSDRRNPYVYAHPVPDAARLAKKVETLSRFHPDGPDMLVRVIGKDYWPLPWYLRKMNRVGYWPEIPDSPDAPVIIAPSGLSLNGRLRGRYTSEHFGLRPDVILLLRAESALWEKSLRVSSPAE